MTAFLELNCLLLLCARKIGFLHLFHSSPLRLSYNNIACIINNNNILRSIKHLPLSDFFLVYNVGCRTIPTTATTLSLYKVKWSDKAWTYYWWFIFVQARQASDGAQFKYNNNIAWQYSQRCFMFAVFNSNDRECKFILLVRETVTRLTQFDCNNILHSNFIINSYRVILFFLTV